MAVLCVIRTCHLSRYNLHCKLTLCRTLGMIISNIYRKRGARLKSSFSFFHIRNRCQEWCRYPAGVSVRSGAGTPQVPVSGVVQVPRRCQCQEWCRYPAGASVRSGAEIDLLSLWFSVLKGASLGDFLLAPACPIEKISLWAYLYLTWGFETDKGDAKNKLFAWTKFKTKVQMEDRNRNHVREGMKRYRKTVDRRSRP